MHDKLTEAQTTALKKFVEQHLHANLAQLALKKNLVSGLENRFVLNQIYGAKKAKTKLPFLFNTPKVLYPAKVSVEQSTSQRVAEWKAQLISGASLLDMTGGFGVDSFFFSKQVAKVVYIEAQSDLFQVVQHNLQLLKATTIETLNTNSTDFLKNTKEHFDWIYLDPARRDSQGNRKIGLADYLPNILEIKTLLFQKGRKILLKTSPMLDIQQAVQQLGTVSKIWIIAVQNEVKELLFLLDATTDISTKRPLLECVNLKKETGEFIYQPSSIANKELNYALPKKYLYEPNAAILKAGLFKEIAIDFGLDKLHPNTHLYTSDSLIEEFPGRIFICEATLAYQRKLIAPYLKNQQANIATRNFPYTVAQMKKKLKIKDGGVSCLFGVRLIDETLKILVCRKVGAIEK